MSLRLDFVSYEFAKFAVMNWHYSRKMPKGPYNAIGVWENDKFIGVVMFGWGGGNATNGTRFGLMAHGEVVELTRIALRAHETPVSRIIRIAVKMFRQKNPAIKLIVSLADPLEKHHGGVYQASGWTYIGRGGKAIYYCSEGGHVYHSRTIRRRKALTHFGKVNEAAIDARFLKPFYAPGKHVYVLPLRDELKAVIDRMKQPYPKRAGSETSDTTVVQTVKGGAAPTPALNLSVEVSHETTVVR